MNRGIAAASHLCSLLGFVASAGCGLVLALATDSLSLIVTFRGPIPYGPALFEAVRQSDVQIATPLVEDTPRAVFDAMAQGMPIVAFGIRYYRDLEELSGAVCTAEWPDIDALADAIMELDRDRARLVQMARAGVRFARANTQEVWLDRRVRWTLEVLDRAHG